MSFCKARNFRTDLHNFFFFFCWLLADDADKLIGRRNCQCGGWLGKLLKKLIHAGVKRRQRGM